MRKMTKLLWEDQDRHPGDRQRLFTAIADAFSVRTVFYPGSFVDISPSFVFDRVTYVDNDLRAAEFFGDVAGVDEIIAEHRRGTGAAVWEFSPADYTHRLDLPTDHYDLLVSLYAGFVSEHCTDHLAPGGILVVHPSHGDAAMASIDARYSLVAVVTSRTTGYAVKDDDLESYLIPKKPTEITRASLHRSGRGVGYTRSPFAYVFQRTTR